MNEVPRRPADNPAQKPPPVPPPDSSAWNNRNEQNRAADAAKQPDPSWARVDGAKPIGQARADLSAALADKGIRNVLPPDAAARPAEPRLTVEQVRGACDAAGMSRNAVNDFRAYLREHPDAAMQIGKDMPTASTILAFARLGDDPRDRQPTPAVDQAIHKALNIPEGRYVPQDRLDQLARQIRDDPDGLKARGLTGDQINKVGGFLDSTGRHAVPHGSQEQLVMDGTGRMGTKEDAARHERQERMAAVAESPLTVSISKWMGLDDQRAYAAGRIASLVTDMAGAAVPHVYEQRARHEAARATPRGPEIGLVEPPRGAKAPGERAAPAELPGFVFREPTATPQPGEYRTAPTEPRGVLGEQSMAFAYGSKGWNLLDGPSGQAGHRWNAPGIDAIAFKAEGGKLEVHLVDNKNLRSERPVTSSTALTDNLATNLGKVSQEIAGSRYDDVPHIAELRQTIADAQAAAAARQPMPPNVTLVITTYGGGRSDGVAGKLKGFEVNPPDRQ
ncbi:hypothetical protein CS0771_40590 [Catellatospora sp. IY07-71]|uniref:hypothetical protein n=1 Tax=Catellatospora sp. IY07-71 TaxID=2728827 RepID=UPI001BB35479|nr:hypothetical protein [Catellatospora sp. IY07-71]BCJ74515.1 hypothetical protein CS0771_40590 [Catellatospora sp. IY07-71]